LYLGGLEKYDAPEAANAKTGFVGCISRVATNKGPIALGSASLESVNVKSCETCKDNPCLNGGVCKLAGTPFGYKCECPSGYSGPTCSDRGARCFPGACSGIGSCYNMIGPDGYECECPLGRSGINCQNVVKVIDPSFNASRSSYMTFKTPQGIDTRLIIALKIKPQGNISDSIIMYSSQSSTGQGDYVTLMIKNKTIEFRFDSGSGALLLRSKHKLVSNEWVSIRAERNLKDGSLRVNEEPSVRGRSPGVTSGLNLRLPLFMGGVDRQTTLPQSLKGTPGLTGCIAHLRVNGKKYRTKSDIFIASSNVNNCGDAGNCARRPCLNGATCLSSSTTPGVAASAADYSCLCAPKFTGKNCETRINVCLTEKPCRNGGLCQATEEAGGFQCRCSLGFGGPLCELEMDLSTSAQFREGAYLVLPRSLMPHTSSHEFETISLIFKTDKMDGLMIWHGQEPTVSGRGQDYFSLGIRNGQVVLSYELGSGIARVVSEVPVVDGQPHRILLSRFGRFSTLSVDEETPIRGESGGSLEVLNAKGDIYIGGVPDLNLMTGGAYTTPFEGCISDLLLTKERHSEFIDFSKTAKEGINVESCPSLTYFLPEE